MPPRLILNADDFGLTRGINRAIAELHTAGCLTSATLMATGPAFDDAVTIAHAHPTLGIGCHIVLVDGAPVLPPETLPTLCPYRRTFRPTLNRFIRDLLLRRIDPAEIEREATAQIQKLQKASIHITHLDTHKHTHIFSSVAAPLLAAAENCNIRCIRFPFEPSWSVRLSTAFLIQRLQVRAAQLLNPRFRTLPEMHTRRVLAPDATLGIAATGNLTPTTLHQILAAVPATGTHELLCHPGYNDADLAALPTRLRHHRETELHALLQEIPQISTLPNAPTLINYSDL